MLLRPRCSKSATPPQIPDISTFTDADAAQWSIVIAGISDFYRPVEQLSVSQNMAITATGAIWTRWCMIVRPQNIPYAPTTALYQARR